MTVESLEDVGLEPMTDTEIRQFLSSQGFGVLGLAVEGVPYMIPMSFGYDDGDHLYFTYLGGEHSRKATLTEEAGAASFLVYNAPAAFQWQSVLITGEIERLPADRWEEFESGMDNAWRPSLLEDAATDASIRVYQLQIESQEGYKHTGLPPGFEEVE